MEVKWNMNNSGQDYNKEEQAIKALQKNYFLCAALTLAVGVGMLAFTSYKVIGIICIVLCVVFGGNGYRARCQAGHDRCIRERCDVI